MHFPFVVVVVVVVVAVLAMAFVALEGVIDGAVERERTMLWATKENVHRNPCCHPIEYVSRWHLLQYQNRLGSRTSSIWILYE